MSSTPFNFPPERYSAVYTNDGATSANVSTDNRGQSRVASLSPGHWRRAYARPQGRASVHRTPEHSTHFV